MCSLNNRRHRLRIVTYYLCNVVMWSLVVLCATILFIFYPWPSTTYMVEPGPKYPPTYGEIWPKPQFEVKEEWYYRFMISSFNVTVINNNCHLLSDAVDRYNTIWRNMYRIPKDDRVGQLRVNDERHADPNYRGFIKELRVNLTNHCENYPHFDMNEQYSLNVGAISNLNSESIWGIIRGLESWTQLLYFTEDYQAIYINETKINDFPQYKHRGLLLDTGRHYLSMKNILTTLDAMAMNKMNVLHWHIVDDQSFPYQSQKFPDLSAKGAFHHTMVYTRDNIKAIINYARDRGIRVLPEFDIPGHTRSWGAAYPQILTKCFNNRNGISLGPLNPIRNATYQMLHELMQEVQDLFPDKYLHVGGDEVDMSCWQSNPELRKYMMDHSLSLKQLHALFMQNVIPLLGDRSIPIVWQALIGAYERQNYYRFGKQPSHGEDPEVFDEDVPLSKDTLVQVWKYVWIEEMVKILSAGHRVVFSSSWYLDYLEFSWDMFYVDDPRLMVYNLKPSANLADIVGGEACMWGEMADDSNLISRTWPRTSAVAERLWTGLDYKNPPKDLITPYVRQRIEEHTCRMKQRGISAEPPNGPGFCVGAV